MGSGLITITVQEASGPIAASADLDRLAIVAGWASGSGSGYSGLSSFFLSGSSAQAVVGYGDASDTLCQVIEQRFPNATSTKFPAALYGMGENGSAGVYGTIDVSGVTGTCVPAVDATVKPYGTYRAAIQIIDDGNDGNGTAIGSTGILYEYALDEDTGDGPTWSNTTPLGTADTITIPNSGVKFDLNPSGTELTALYSKLNTLKTTVAAHFTTTSGSPAVHAASDTTDNTALTAVANATTPATAVTLFNSIKSYLSTHGASTTYHTTADTALATALAAISNAVTVADVDARINALITAYNAHRILVGAGPVHGSADSTNTITAYTAAPGTLKTGDVFFVRTLAPTPSATDVDDMFDDLVKSRYDFGLLILDFPMTASLAAHVTTGLNSLRDKAGKRPTVIARTRIPDFETSEDDATWNASISGVFPQGTVDDSRIHLRGTYTLITDAMTSREYLRSDLAQFSADTVRVDRSVWPGAPADQATGAPNVRLTNDIDVLVGHDEGPRGDSTGLSNTTLLNRFGCQQRVPNPLTREAVYNTFPWVLFPQNGTIRNLMARRVANAMERDAVNAAQAQMGGRIFYTPADPADPQSVPTLTEVSRNALHAAVYNVLSENFRNDIQNWDDADPDTGLVQVSSTVVVTDGNVVGATIVLRPLMFGYLANLTIVVSPKE
jgi:hypothetical protein